MTTYYNGTWMRSRTARQEKIKRGSNFDSWGGWTASSTSYQIYVVLDMLIIHNDYYHESWGPNLFLGRSDRCVIDLGKDDEVLIIIHDDKDCTYLGSESERG